MKSTYVPQPIDEALRMEVSATKTADFDGTSLDNGVGYAAGGVGQPVGAVINVTAIDRTTGDETYAFVLQESADNATWKSIGPAVTTTEVGAITAPGFLTERYVRVQLDVGGTTPSVTFEAWLHPNVNA